MPLYDEKRIWEEIVTRSELGADAKWLELFRPEFKRQALFLRPQADIALPDIVSVKLGIAAESMGYHFRVTTKWATMTDLAEAVGNVEWLWKNFIPLEMITILAGDPGTSKSTLALWLCKLVTEGGEWPDGNSRLPANVIYVDAEAAQVITKQRCINMRMNTDRIYVPNLGNDMLAQPDLNDDSHKEQLYNMVEEVRPELVVVDSLGGVKSGRENNKEDMQPTMLFLTRLVQNRKCAILVIHHLNKTKREEDEEIAMNHLRGSGTIAQFARSIIFLSRKLQGTMLYVGKSNLSLKPDPLLLRFQEERVSSEDGYDTIIRGIQFEEWQEEVKLTKHQECEQWLIETLDAASEKKMMAREVYEASKDEPFTLQMVKSAAAMLEKRGIIHRSGGKFSVYTLLQPSMRLEEIENEL